MASAGGDVSPIISKIAAVIKSRQKGLALEDAVGDIFAPAAPTPPVGAPASPEQPSPVPGGAPAGGQPEAMAPPTAPPDIQTILSTLSGSGKASGRVTTKG
jgi:hypothetical protein